MAETEWIEGGVGVRVPKTIDFPAGWKELELQEIKLNPRKKTVLFFGGNGTIWPAAANFGSKFVESLIGRAEQEKYELFSFYYGHFKNDTTGSLSETFNAKIYNAFLKPLVCNKNGKPLSEKQIEKNLSKLVLVGHCFGAVVSDTLLGNVAEFLTPKFGEEKTKKLLQNVFVVCFEPHKKHKFGTTVNFLSLRDMHTVKPNYVERRQALDKKEEFFGVAKIMPNKQLSGLEIFSNTFVALEKYVDEHSIGLIEKEKGVINREFLPDYVIPETTDDFLFIKKKRPNVYSRQQAISDLFGIAVAYAVASEKPDLKELGLMLANQIEKDNKTIFEQEQKALFTEKQAGGRSLEKVLEESNISLADVLAGKIKKYDLKIPWSGVDKNNFVADALVYGIKNQKFLASKIYAKSQSGYGFGLGSYTHAAFDENGELKHKTLLLSSGSNAPFLDERSAIAMQVAGESLDGSIIMTTTIHEKEQDFCKNKIDVDVGLKFKNETFNSVEQMKQKAVPSFEGKQKLSPEQTRVILNEAIFANVPLQNICCHQGIKLNKNVLNTEIVTDPNGTILQNILKDKKDVKGELKNFVDAVERQAKEIKKQAKQNQQKVAPVANTTPGSSDKTQGLTI